MDLDTSFAGIVSMATVFLFLTTTTVILRFISRRKQGGQFWVDDFLAIAALVGFIGMVTAVLYGVAHKYVGYPQPKSKDDVNRTHPTLELTYISLDATQTWTFGTVKLSALFFYRRVFCTRVKRDLFDYATWFFIFIVSAWIIGFLVFTFEVCPGHSVQWYIQPGRIGSCQPNLDYPYFDASTISDFILDVLVLGMAFPKIWTFHLSKSQKMGISGVFLLALGGVAASCTRMVVITHITRTGRAINDEDGYEVNTQAAYYSLLEGGLSLVCVNLPSIWYFVSGGKAGNMLHAVRSLVSLRSGSTGRAASQNKPDRMESFGQQSTIESNAMHEKQTNEHEGVLPERTPKDRIQVDHSVEVRRQ